jgi:hypothetical protein
MYQYAKTNPTNVFERLGMPKVMRLSGTAMPQPVKRRRAQG